MFVSCPASPWTPGTFTLKLKASQGEGSCKSDAEADASITVFEKPVVTLTGPADGSVCTSDSQKQFEYTVSPVDAVINVTPTGFVTCEQGEVHGCSWALVSF